MSRQNVKRAIWNSGPAQPCVEVGRMGQRYGEVAKWNLHEDAEEGWSISTFVPVPSI